MRNERTAILSPRRKMTVPPFCHLQSQNDSTTILSPPVTKWQYRHSVTSSHKMTEPPFCLPQWQNPMLKLIRKSVTIMDVFTFYWALWAKSVTCSARPLRLAAHASNYNVSHQTLDSYQGLWKMCLLIFAISARPSRCSNSRISKSTLMKSDIDKIGQYWTPYVNTDIQFRLCPQFILCVSHRTQYE